MKPIRVHDVVEATGAFLVSGDPSALVCGVSTDTRTLRAGELFVALSGPNFDGNRFATAAVERGAAGLLLESPGGAPRPGLSELCRGTPILTQPILTRPILTHRAPRAALASLARWHRDRLAASVVGITGSCGKTTTKSVLAELLASRMPTVASPDSFNNDVGVPHTLFLAGEDTRAVVVEMGTNHPGEIASLCRIARPTAGVVTCVGASHLEGLGSVEGVAREKRALVESIPSDGFVVLNADCAHTARMRASTSARVLTFSIDGHGDLNATNVFTHAGGTTFRLEGREVTSPLLGLHNVQNLLAALAVCRGLWIRLDDALPAVSRLRGGRRRLERTDVGGMTILDDSYNANPESARAGVRVLAGFHGHARRVLVLGDMLELGAVAAREHYDVGREAALAGVDVLVAVGTLAREAADGAVQAGLCESSVLRVPSIDEAAARVPAMLRRGDVVLVKGSRKSGLDRLVQRFVAFAREDAA